MSQGIRKIVRAGRWPGLLFGVLFLIAQGCASTPSVQEQRDLAREKYSQAIKLQNSKMIDEMIATLREAVKLDPEEPLYRMALANVLFSKENLDEAAENYRKVLQLNPKMTEAYKQLGRLYMQKGDWVNAQIYLEEAATRPGLVRPHELLNWLAITYYAQGRFNDAEKKWKDALEIMDNFEIRMNLARAYRDHELFDLAQDSLEKALTLNPRSAQVHYQLAQLYLKKREFPRARRHFSQVIQLEPLGEMAKASRKYLELMPPEKQNGG